MYCANTEPGRRVLFAPVASFVDAARRGRTYVCEMLKTHTIYTDIDVQSHRDTFFFSFCRYSNLRKKKCNHSTSPRLDDVFFFLLFHFTNIATAVVVAVAAVEIAVEQINNNAFKEVKD